MLPTPSRPIHRCLAAAWRARGWLAYAASSLALITVRAAPAQDIPAVGVTFVAQSAGARTPFPDATSSGFEAGAVGAGQFFYASQFPNGVWASWTFSGYAGIASNNSGFTGPQAAPENTRVALLQGGGSMSTVVPVQQGHWRLRFLAAQRANHTPSAQIVRVRVAGVEVFEVMIADTTYRPYTTRTFTTNATNLTVIFEGTNTDGDHTAFLDAIELEPIADWNTQSTWLSPGLPGLPGLPGASNPVHIPANIEVAVRGAAVAQNVTVNGELVTTFDSATLDARWVMVSGAGARFEVGHLSTPFAQQFTLTLLGTGPNENIHNAGTKFLMAMDGGTIEMHGSTKTSWTKLTSLGVDTPVGGPSVTTITVDQCDDWQPGDEIVIAYTGHVSHIAGWATANCPATPYAGPRSQRRTISTIDHVAKVVTLPGTLNASEHCSAAPSGYTGPNHPAGWVLDQRAEVGMLTHNVRIRGEPTTTGFGGHVMIMACCNLMPAGLGRFSNVELFDMGQKQQLGRYPMHWHMVRNIRPGQFLINSSIHDTHNRAITVHGSHDVVVGRNVCFDVAGHAVFLEDGVERGNLFQENLVLAPRKPVSCQQMLPHDNSRDEAQNRSPASFWISNPDNYFVGNVAADSLGVGYWFALHHQATGVSSNPAWGMHTVRAVDLGLGAFAGNVAHSLKMGIDVHDSVADAVGAMQVLGPCLPATNVPCTNPQPTQPTIGDPVDDDVLANWQWRPSQAPVFMSGTIYGCTTGLYSGGGFDPTQVTFDDFVLADNGTHTQFASSETVTDSLFVFDSGNGIFPQTPNSYIGPGSFEVGNVFVTYDGPGRIFDSHLVGYDGNTGTAANVVYSGFGAARRHTNHQLRGLSFAGGGIPAISFRDWSGATTVPPGYVPSNAWGIAVQDVDGCLTGGTPPANKESPFWPGVTPHTLVTNHPMMHLTSGTKTPDLQAPYLPANSNAWLSPFRWAHFQVRWYQQTYTLMWLETELPPVTFTRQEHQGWPGRAFAASTPQSLHMRQLPVIVKPANTQAEECVYVLDLEVRVSTPAVGPLANRVDVAVDDATPGDITRVHIVPPPALANWTPTLRVNDNPAFVNHNGANPLPPTVLSPGLSSGPTSYQMITVNGRQAIDLRMVNVNRTHRITITW